MEITKKKLKEIIKEEMDLLSTVGDIHAPSISEMRMFQMILDRLSDEHLKNFGLKKTIDN